MMRMRYLLIGLGIVIGLTALALAVFIATFDANRYKATLIDTVEERTGRQLTIEGDLSLTLFPRIALSIGRAQLSGPDGAGDFAQIESARIGVALWPLLSRHVQVERISLDGLKLEAVRHADGSTNYGDLLASGSPNNAQRHGESSATPATAPGDAASAAAGAITIAQLVLRNAAIGWRDETSDTQWRLQQVDLDADRIASGEPGRLRMTGRLIGKQPSIAADLKLSGGYRADFATGRLDLADLKLDAHTDDGIEASLDAPALTIADGAAEGKPVVARLRLQQDVLKVDARLSVAAPSRLQGQYVFREIAADAQASGAQFPADGVKLTLVGDGALSPGEQTATLSLRGSLDGSPLQARLSAKRFSPLAIQYELRADRLDLDRYRRGDKAQEPTPGAAAPAAAAPASGSAKETVPTPAGTPIPLPPIADIESEGSLGIGTLHVAGADAHDVAMTIRSGGGRVELDRLRAGIYQGSLTGNAALGTDGRHSMKLQLTGIDVGMALKHLAGRDVLDGRGNLALDVAGTGTTVQALERSLDGSARLALRDGAVLGIDLSKVLQQAESALAAVRGGGSAIDQKAGAGEKTAFSSLDASFAIRDGIARSDDLDIRSPLLRVGGTGQIDLPASRIDYLLRVSLVGTLAGQGGAARSALRGVTIPVRVSGPFTSLGYRIDMASLARDTVGKEVKRQLEERLLGKPEAGSDETGKPAKPTNPRDLLRGLIGR